MADLKQRDIAMIIGGIAILWWFTSRSSGGKEKDPMEEDDSTGPNFPPAQPIGGAPGRVPPGGPEGLKGGGSKPLRGGGGTSVGDFLGGQWNKRRPPRGGPGFGRLRVPKRPKNQAVTAAGMHQQWATGSFRALQRTEKETVTHLRKIMQGLDDLVAVQTKNADKALRGEMDNNAKKWLMHFQGLRAQSLKLRGQYEALISHLSGRGDGIDAASFYQRSDQFSSKVAMAVSALAHHIDRDDKLKDRVVRAMEQEKMEDNRRASAERARIRADSQRKQGALMSRLTKEQRNHRLDSASASAKIDQLENALQDSLDATMREHKTGPVKNSFQTDGEWNGTFQTLDAVEFAGGTMSRDADPVESMQTWVQGWDDDNGEVTDTELEHDHGIVVDNTADRAEPMKPLMGFKPPVDLVTVDHQPSADEIAHTRANLQKRLGSGTLTDAEVPGVAKKLAGLENLRTAEVTRDARVTGSESTTIDALFNTAPVQPDPHAPSNTDTVRAAAMSGQQRVRRKKKTVPKVKVQRASNLGSSGSFSVAPTSLLGDTSRNKVSGVVANTTAGNKRARPDDPVTADFDTTLNDPVGGDDEPFTPRKKSKAVWEQEQVLSAIYASLLQKGLGTLSKAKGRDDIQQVNADHARLATLQPHEVQTPGFFASKRQQGTKSGSPNYLQYLKVMRRADGLQHEATVAHQRAVEADLARRNARPGHMKAPPPKKPPAKPRHRPKLGVEKRKDRPPLRVVSGSEVKPKMGRIISSADYAEFRHQHGLEEDISFSRAPDDIGFGGTN